jgi:hypothetical protein
MLNQRGFLNWETIETEGPGAEALCRRWIFRGAKALRFLRKSKTMTFPPLAD